MKQVIRDLLLFVNKILNIISYKDNGYFVFGEWLGKQANDNCLFLANYICRNYPDIPIAWICDSSADVSLIDKKIEKYSMDSAEALRIIKNARVLIMNQGLADFSRNPSFNICKPLSINLWHGIPWKKIGYDGVKKRGLLRDLEHRYHIFIRRASYFVSPSQEYSEKLMSAFFLKEKSIISSGFPRNSLFYNGIKVKEARSYVLNLIHRDNAYIIAYLPTFRDTQTRAFSFSDITDPDFLQWIEDRNIYIIQKAHAAGVLSSETKNNRVISINNISAQQLMAASDMLITDYSSCFFDYLLLDRPIIHYLYDYSYYKDFDRGLYYKKEEVVCGSAPETVVELVQQPHFIGFL